MRVRGGAWGHTTAINFRMAYRNRNDPTITNTNTGFRLARVPERFPVESRAAGR